MSTTVAMATWNDSKWLPEQLASIATQTLPALLVVGDDRSTDETPAILDDWATRMPLGLRKLPDTGNHGVIQNFSRTLTACETEWVACCDQDDIWHPDHIERLHTAGTLAARKLGSESPILVVGDIRVIDSDRKPISPSLWRLQNFDPRCGIQLRSLVLMNMFPGCTMLMNQALLRLALPIPEQAIMHDWWLALCASALGTIVVVEETLGAYRQHGANVLGARSLLQRVRCSRPAYPIDRVAAQSAALLARHQQRLGQERRGILEAARQLQSPSSWGRRRIIIRHGLTKHPWWRQLKFLLRDL